MKNSIFTASLFALSLIYFSASAQLMSLKSDYSFPSFASDTFFQHDSTAYSPGIPEATADSITVPYLRMNQRSDLRKNAIYVELGGTGILGSLNYSRIMPFGEKHGIALTAGVAFYGDAIVNASYLLGRTNKFFEVGVGYSFIENFVTPQIGYRFQGKKGFLFRATAMYLTDEAFVDGIVFAGLSFGYSF